MSSTASNVDDTIIGHHLGKWGNWNDAAGNAAHARVFKYANEAWSQYELDIDGDAAADQFGSAVLLSADGERLAVGDSYNDDGGNSAGHVRIFDEPSSSLSSWGQVGDDIDGITQVNYGGDYFGDAVALSADGSRVVIGVEGNDNAGSGDGTVRVYE